VRDRVSRSETSAVELLRADLLEGAAVLVVGASGTPPGGALAAEVRETCAALGASVSTCTPGAGSVDADGEAALAAAVASAVGEQGRIDLLTVDGAGLYAEGLARSGDGHAALRACMDGAWSATRAVVNHAFLQASEPRGRIVYLAPAPAAGEHAPAACAGLENLARTLSTEWARYQITTVTIAPGDGTSVEEVATLVAYLASPAGAYFSGCLLDLRGGA
jgi:NAD(P)-dependent dehydrogenase (short-subunit alcohol dehydrogenase family)